MKKSIILLFFIILFCSSLTIYASPESIGSDWMIPKACFNFQNIPVPVDPYPSCPDKTYLRSLAIGDPLPYRKQDQQRQQFKDIYPAIAADGTPLLVATFNFHDPKNGNSDWFKVFIDGYDAYVLKDGWASGSETRMGTGEYATSFLNTDCKNYNSLIFFPLIAKDGIVPNGSIVQGGVTVPWEENGQQWPGECPALENFSTQQFYSWTNIPQFPFGSNQNIKKMDTLVSTMGWIANTDPQVIKRWLHNGHLEVFYFTKLYGLSRWESWIPEEQFLGGNKESATQVQNRTINAAKGCSSGSNMQVQSFNYAPTNSSEQRYTMQYQGHLFTMNDCRDWSNIVIQTTPINPPAWPVSALNLLSNFHFNLNENQSLTPWDSSKIQHGEIKVSNTVLDTTKDTSHPLKGINYLKINCTNGCNDSISQEFAANSIANGNYIVGVIGRTEEGSGVVTITIRQLDSSHKQLEEKSFNANLNSQNLSCDSHGEHCKIYIYDQTSGSGSIILSSKFVYSSLSIRINPQAQIIQYSLTPKTSATFDLVSAWFMRD